MPFMRFHVLFTCVALAASSGCRHAGDRGYGSADTASGETGTEQPSGIAFGWPFSEDGEVSWRGGTTRGRPVTLADEPRPGWENVREAEVGSFERDRRAILAMAGAYRVSFQFLETMGFRPGFEPRDRYFSWATEHIQVLEDKGDFLRLQHTLVLYFENEDGETEGPMVMKHWRQDWTYEPDSYHAYIGGRVWERREVSSESSEGVWKQEVYQVDGAPRYTALGEWRHGANYASWQSREFRRPLPRREFSVRDDYDVLQGTNTITLTPGGWVHEQQNRKLILPGDKPGATPDHLAAEYGINRYERIAEPELSAAEDYWERTGAFWKAVRRAWSAVLDEHDRFRVEKKVDGEKRFNRLFDYADGIESADAYDAEAGREFARKTIREYVEESPTNE